MPILDFDDMPKHRRPFEVLTIFEYRRRLAGALGISYEIAREITDAMTLINRDAISNNEGIPLPYIGAITMTPLPIGKETGLGAFKMRGKAKLRKSTNLIKNLRGEDDKFQED